MVDPHVVALTYRIEHSSSVAYRNPPPLAREESQFRLEVKEGTVRFQFKEHFPTEREARDAVAEYIESWQMSADLERGPGSFRLAFQGAEVVDRQPPPGVVNIRASASTGRPRASARAQAVSRHYPKPPAHCDFQHPDVKAMYVRYIGHRQGEEPLVSMAYFCLTVLEHSVQPPKRREKAARRWRIEKAVLDRVAELSSTRGGTAARKAEGIGKPLRSEEERFLRDAIRSIIGHAGRMACSTGTPPDRLNLRAIAS